MKVQVQILHMAVPVKAKVKRNLNQRIKKQRKERQLQSTSTSGNGRLPLHESVVIGLETKFVRLTHDNEFELLDSVEDGSEIFIPKGRNNTTSPLSYVFTNEEELAYYLNQAKSETFDSLLTRVDTIQRKFLNVEGQYHTIMASDIIWSYFQDRFPYTHYLIFVGDNGSGKNSALLLFKFLGYRVFYVVSTSAANYFTVMGNREEGQVTTAEDEVEDIGDAHNYEKRNIFKSGYCSGASIPKTELEGGRSQDNWLIYCLKWLAMEELKEDKYTKGILHRSFKLKMLAGDVDYNIKDVIRFADDPKYKKLEDEIFDLRKRLFCFRLLHHKDPIPFIELNVKGRTAELTNPLIRLFQNSPVALEKILNSLSMFIQERNETNANSIESKLYQTTESLISERAARTLDPTDEDILLEPYQFTNQTIKEKLIEMTEAQEDPEKKGMYYSPEIGGFSQSKITTILKSKFKVKLDSVKINGKTHRCVEFEKKYLVRIKSNYEIPDKIRIIKPNSKPKQHQSNSELEPNSNADIDSNQNQKVTLVTPVTPLWGMEANLDTEQKVKNTYDTTKIEENAPVSYDNYNNLSNNYNGEGVKSVDKRPSIPQNAVTSVTSVTAVTEPKEAKSSKTTKERKLIQHEKEDLASNSNGVTYICPDCKEWLHSDTLSKELHQKSCKGGTQS